MIPDEILRKAYWHVLANPHGYWSDLDQIGEGIRDYLEKENVIACGFINAKAQLRYKLIVGNGERIAKVQYTSLTLKLYREKNNCAIIA